MNSIQNLRKDILSYDSAIDAANEVIAKKRKKGESTKLEIRQLNHLKKMKSKMEEDLTEKLLLVREIEEAVEGKMKKSRLSLGDAFQEVIGMFK